MGLFLREIIINPSLLFNLPQLDTLAYQMDNWRIQNYIREQDLNTLQTEMDLKLPQTSDLPVEN